jgi:hypothetical protein
VEYSSPSASTTLTVSVFCWKVTESIEDGLVSIRWRSSLKVGVSFVLGGLISRCAKKASTITIRIGNAALLKNRLMGVIRAFGPRCCSDQRTRGN